MSYTCTYEREWQRARAQRNARERERESWVCNASNKFPKLMNIFLYNYYKFFEMIYDDYLNVVIQYFVFMWQFFFFGSCFFYNSPCRTKKMNKKNTKRTNEKRRSMSSKLNAIVTVSVCLLENLACCTILWCRTMVTIVKYWLFCFINLVNVVVGK